MDMLIIIVSLQWTERSITNLTLTIFKHCVPLPAPGAPRTNTTLGFIVELMAKLLIALNKRLNIQTATSYNNC
jgi:hypothetical protein